MKHDARVVCITAVSLPPYRTADVRMNFKGNGGTLDDGKELVWAFEAVTDGDGTNLEWLRDVLVMLVEKV